MKPLRIDGTFEVFESRDGYRWRLKGRNHKVMCQSEGYSSKRKAFAGAIAVQRVCSGVTCVVEEHAFTK